MSPVIYKSSFHNIVSLIHYCLIKDLATMPWNLGKPWKIWDVNCVTSWSNYHQSNGLPKNELSLSKLVAHIQEIRLKPSFCLVAIQKYTFGNEMLSPMELLGIRHGRSDFLVSSATQMQVGWAATKPQVNRSHSELMRSTSRRQTQATSNLLATGMHVM